MNPGDSLVQQAVEACRAAAGSAGAQERILQCALAVQTAVGHVPQEAVSTIARALSVTEADVAGVLSFYPDLRSHPTGRHVIRVCRGESCMANHAARVVRALQDALRVELGDTTSNGRFTLERVYCVGNCAVSPTVVIGDRVYGRVTPEDIPYLLETYR